MEILSKNIKKVRNMQKTDEGNKFDILGYIVYDIKCLESDVQRGLSWTIKNC